MPPPDGVVPLAARAAAPDAATPPGGGAEAAEAGSALFLKGVLAALRAENERLYAELDTQRCVLLPPCGAARARLLLLKPPQSHLGRLWRTHVAPCNAAAR
jgi:hypothetical protein